MTGRTVVMDRNNRILVFLAKGTDYIIGTLLHFRIRTLNGIQLDA